MRSSRCGGASVRRAAHTIRCCSPPLLVLQPPIPSHPPTRAHTLQIRPRIVYPTYFADRSFQIIDDLRRVRDGERGVITPPAPALLPPPATPHPRPLCPSPLTLRAPPSQQEDCDRTAADGHDQRHRLCDPGPSVSAHLRACMHACMHTRALACACTLPSGVRPRMPPSAPVVHAPCLHAHTPYAPSHTPPLQLH